MGSWFDFPIQKHRHTSKVPYTNSKHSILKSIIFPYKNLDFHTKSKLIHKNSHFHTKIHTKLNKFYTFSLLFFFSLFLLFFLFYSRFFCPPKKNERPTFELIHFLVLFSYFITPRSSISPLFAINYSYFYNSIISYYHMTFVSYFDKLQIYPFLSCTNSGFLHFHVCI